MISKALNSSCSHYISNPGMTLATRSCMNCEPEDHIMTPVCEAHQSKLCLQCSIPPPSQTIK